MTLYYKLDENKNPVGCTLQELHDVFGSDRTIKQEHAVDKWVSTIFLCINHNFGFSDCTPILFESMVFHVVDGQPDASCYQERYHTYDEAIDGHNIIVEKIKQGLPLDAYEEF